MSALQQLPVTFQSRSPPYKRISRELRCQKPLRVSLSDGFTSFELPKLKIELPRKLRSGGGAVGARMAVSAAGSYAAALADVAKSKGTLDSTSDDVENLEKIFSVSDVFDFFTNPTIEEEKKRKVIEEMASSSGLQPHTVNFLKILVDVKRIDLIKEIAKEFELVYNKLTDTELAIVSSVVPLERRHLAQIAKRVQKLTGAKNVRIKTAIEPSLVAGFTIRFGNSGSKLIDMSVKRQLEEIATQLDIQLAV